MRSHRKNHYQYYAGQVMDMHIMLLLVWRKMVE